MESKKEEHLNDYKEMQLQWALEQHEFELHGSTYLWIFYNKYYSSTIVVS